MTEWTFYAGWLTARHDCTLEGIISRCGGCCKSTKYWPAAAFGAADGACGHLGSNGCVLSADDKPVTCHLYPLIVKQGVVKQDWRKTCSSAGVCKGNHNQGPMLVDALRSSFVALFGEEVYQRIRSDAISGKKPVITVPLDVEKAWNDEQIELAGMIKVPPRSSR